MPKVDDEVLRQRFLKAKEAWDERQKVNRARRRREKAQADTLRDSLIARLVWHEVDGDQHKYDRLMSKLDAFLEDDKHRALFNLSPRAAAPASAVPTGPPSSVDSPRP